MCRKKLGAMLAGTFSNGSDSSSGAYSVSGLFSCLGWPGKAFMLLKMLHSMVKKSPLDSVYKKRRLSE